MSDHPKTINTAIDADAGDLVYSWSGQPSSCVSDDADVGIPVIDDALLAKLCNACLAPSRRGVAEASRAIRDAGHSAQDIAEVYVPAAARIMGARWCDDSMSFAEVTIGCSRLHTLLRDVQSEWTPDNKTGNDARSMLVLVGKDSFHTLGATVLAGMMRRLGVSTRLCIGAEANEIAQMIRATKFDCVLISVSIGESLETTRKIVESVKSASIEPLLVIVGGTILEGDEGRAQEILAVTAADHVTNDPNEAIRLCGLQNLRAPTRQVNSVTPMRRS
jgi:methylmalonyl-CoA mutase cobalamin-binding subunit